MEKLFLMSIFLLSYWLGMAQDSITNRNQQNIPNQQTVPNPPAIQNQPSTPVSPKPPDQPAAPITPGQSNISTQPTTPPVPLNQATIPDQTTVPVKPAAPAVQPAAPVQSQIQSNEPVQQNTSIQPNINPGKKYPTGTNYQQMSDEALIGGRVVRFTFIASPQVTWMTSGSREVSDSKSKFGFAYGVEGDIFLASERYSLLTGMVVSSLGGTLGYKVPIRFGGVDLPAGSKVEYFIRYLEIPIALKMRSKDFNNMRFFAQFGLNTWMNIKAKASTSDGSYNKETASDEVRFFNIGLNVGAGVEYDLGNRNSLTGGIVYAGSFNDSTNNSTVSDKTTINSLRIRLGFIF